MPSPYSFPQMLENTLPYYRKVVDAGDNVLIISDTNVEDDVAQVFSAAARVCDAKPTIMIITPLERDYSNPPDMVMQAGEAADVIHYAASTALVHSQFGSRMAAAHKRRINSDNIDARQLVFGAINANQEELLKWRGKIDKYWESGKRVHVTSALGTDLWIDIDGRKPYIVGQKYRHVQFPGGEATIAPIEHTAEGVLYVDRAAHFIGNIRVPVKLTLEKGRITKIEGGDEAYRFERWLKKYSDENGYRISELAVGTNPEAFFMGSMRQDRFILGSSHVGFGLNKDVGGVQDSNIHYDCIYACPTIDVDGTIIVDKGKIVACLVQGCDIGSWISALVVRLNQKDPVKLAEAAH